MKTPPHSEKKKDQNQGQNWENFIFKEQTYAYLFINLIYTYSILDGLTYTVG